MLQIKKVPAAIVWPIRHVVMYPDKPFSSIMLPEDEQGTHLALYDNDILISVISLFCYDNELQFRKFATIQEYQGKGYGSQLLSYVIEMAMQKKIRRIWCNARKSAASFYRRFGFEETRDVFRKGDIDYVIMQRWLD